ncbi:hypothetical protein T440DRAFT_547672 [Plenodomus tracheiphilus IPT5]|uniref:Uncharacterized protein n=1 Tax=Plenodomus tracheiphilus IPT5 TaxID=1408161 RepID=A0A6A7BDM2_9PLEO|nr:hypothetical protein T440DRAFT_547672 [Plenodomus tracheiphilus IPT5]
MLFIGDFPPRFSGMVNEYQTFTLADFGLRVLYDSGPEDRVALMFADSSTKRISGMAYNVNWEFGSTGQEKSYCSTFTSSKTHLRIRFLFDEDDDLESVDSDGGSVFAIDFAKICDYSGQHNGFDQHAEDIRRGEEDDLIENLPASARAAAERAIMERRKQWDDARAAAASGQMISSAAQYHSHGVAPSTLSSAPGASDDSPGVAPHISTATHPPQMQQGSPMNNDPMSKHRKWRFRVKKRLRNMRM